jgi:hypothetical protein
VFDLIEWTILGGVGYYVQVEIVFELCRRLLVCLIAKIFVQAQPQLGCWLNLDGLYCDVAFSFEKRLLGI